jgi:prepilin peptidase CpaA
MAEPVTNSPTEVEPSPPAADVNWAWLWAAIVLLALSGAVIGTWLRGTGGGIVLPTFALLVCMLAAFFDAATGRIPNPITYPAILSGLLLISLPPLMGRFGAGDLAPWLGSVGAAQAWLGFAACAGIGLVCLLSAGMGGGDAKLIVALGAMLGFSQAGHVLLWALAIAVPYALVNLIIRGRLNAVLGAAALQVLHIVILRRLEPVPVASRSSIPLAVPLAAAIICARAVPREAVTRWLGS